MKIVIIGGQAAGMSAAAKAKRMAKDAEVVVYEASDIVSFGACGLPYFVGDFFSNEERMLARSVESFRESGVQVHNLCQVEQVNHEEKSIRVRNLQTNKCFNDKYDQLLIATGASAIIPPWKGTELENVFTLKTMQDGVALRKAVQYEKNQHIVIIGAGYIGLELVEAMKKLGKHVTLLQRSAHILSNGIDAEIAEIVEDELLSHGVNFKCEEHILSIEGIDKVSCVRTDKGKYKADVVVIATGIRPNTQFLNQEVFEMLPNGALIINEYGQTNIPNIYAAGDCATVFHLVSRQNKYIPLATTANKIGRAIGENLTGARNVFEGTLGSACIKVMDLEVAHTGITEKEAKRLELPYRTAFVSEKNQTNYYPGQVPLYIKLIYHAKTKKILGAQMAGKKQVVHRMDALAVAIYAGLTTEQLGMMDFCYAPPFSKSWDILNVVGNVAK